MKIIFVALSIAYFIGISFTPVSAQMGGMMPGMMGQGHGLGEKNPSVAALLSLQPMPLALGNFYADDWEKSILYTTVEVGLAIPGIILLSDRYGDHFHDGGAQDGWTDTERVWFISLVTGYVLTKVLSAYDAASSVERQMKREQRVSLHMTGHTQGVLLKASVTF